MSLPFSLRGNFSCSIASERLRFNWFTYTPLLSNISQYFSFRSDNVSFIFNTNKKLQTNSIQRTRKTIKMAGGKAGKDSGKMKAKAVSRSAKSGLQFPVGRIHRHLKSRTTSHGRIGATAAVYRYEDGRIFLQGKGEKNNKLKFWRISSCDRNNLFFH